MADGDVAGETLQVLLAEGLHHKPHGGAGSNGLAIADADARALLAAMLKRKKPEESGSGYVFPWGIYAEYPAFLMRQIARFCPHPPRRKGHLVQEPPSLGKRADIVCPATGLGQVAWTGDILYRRRQPHIAMPANAGIQRGEGRFANRPYGSRGRTQSYGSTCPPWAGEEWRSNQHWHNRRL